MFQRWGILAVVWVCVIGMASAARAQEEALCAEVRIEILQELTLERQGFEAIMRITNSLDSYSIEEIAITVNFTDADGNEVIATSDTAASDAEFFIRVNDTRNVNSLTTADNGAVTDGVINAGNVGEFRWLIVPTANAAGETDNGNLFFVGATLSYSYGGKEEVVQVAPDSIVVKPQPLLTLDYFLTEQVVGDDAFTQEIEPPEPYTLGLRIDNSGFGSAKQVKIESAQPTIVDNQQGLAIDFTITKSFVGNEPAAPSLLMDFGVIASEQMKSGRWIMESSLSGQFTSFIASFTHADELGGELTSLLEATNAHLLVKDVLVNLPGRDGVLDFLAYGADSLLVYESEATGADLAICKSCAEVTALNYTLGSENAGTRKLTGTAAKGGFGLIRVSDPYQGSKSLRAVMRADGKPLTAANFWLSKERAENDIDFNYFINVFDFAATDSYTLQFIDRVAVPQPPVIQAILDKRSYEGGQMGFVVQSSDPNGTIPQLLSGDLPVGASFSDSADGTGIFRWQPAIGQAGNYNVLFIASDGELSSERRVNLSISSAADTDGDGMADDWEMENFGNLDRDGSGDFDEDGRTDAEEEEVGSDPKLAEVAPGTPQILSPLFDAEVLEDADALLPTLTVTNGTHDPVLSVAYEFEVYADEAMLQKVAAERVDEGAETTEWAVTAEDLMPEQGFADNRLYYWRARAITRIEEGSAESPVASLWVSSRFFINRANDAPSAPMINAPQINAVVADLRPLMIISHAFDIDRDLLNYGFDLYRESDLENIASVSGLLPGGNFQTQWRAPNPLQENDAYVWTAWAEDEHGARTTSELGTFVVSSLDDAPSEPVVLSPNGILFTWLPNNGVELRVRNASDPEQQPLSYYFELDTVASFDSGAAISSDSVMEGQSETTWLVEGLQEDITYYWRAKASDGAVESQWVNASFSVDADNTPPPAPSLHNPGADAMVETLRPLFEVNPVVDPDGDALQYHFEVYTDAALTLLAASQVQVGTQWTPDFDLSDKSDYYWRARAEDAKGAVSDWSSANAFVINASSANVAPKINLVLPDSEVTVSAPELLIQWQDSDPDNNASIALYYLYEGGDRTTIIEGIEEDLDGAADQYLWDVTDLPPGNYTLEAEINDGETTTTADGCCNIIVPEKSKPITIFLPICTDDLCVIVPFYTREKM